MLKKNESIILEIQSVTSEGSGVGRYEGMAVFIPGAAPGDRLAVKMSSIRTKVQFLSGGNQQKAIVSRWLLKDLDVLVFIEPTRGVDVGAKADIYKILEDLAAEGKAIVVVSTDTQEILQLSDRIFVMCGGRVSSVIEGKSDEETLARRSQGNPEESTPAAAADKGVRT